MGDWIQKDWIERTILPPPICIAILQKNPHESNKNKKKNT